MIDLMFGVKVAQAHSLSEVMIGAIVSGDNGEAVTAGPKQIRALVERGIVDESHVLTDFGQLLLRLFTSPETLNEEEQNELLTVSTPNTKGAFLVDVSASELSDMIRPCEDGEEGLSFQAAKENLAEHFTNERDRFRKLLKDVRSLRRKDVGADSESAPEGDDVSEDESEPAFA